VRLVGEVEVEGGTTESTDADSVNECSFLGGTGGTFSALSGVGGSGSFTRKEAVPFPTLKAGDDPEPGAPLANAGFAAASPMILLLGSLSS
jgi:hypothetical protein